MTEERKRECAGKAAALVAQMTVEEAASQMCFDAPAIPGLGVPEYNWWNEALHGVARAGTATSFPQAIALAAAFDADLLKTVAGAIAEEARAKYNYASRRGDRGRYKGLTFWSPNVNIFRDPRWGRGHETYGEDPYLTARLGVAFIGGLQGDGETLKAAACAKHYAVHSGPEALRHEFNAECSQKDLFETYLPAFEACVREAGVEAVMGAYNRTLGEPCCASRYLLVDILRGRWGFDGHIVSDCWALQDIHEHHMITRIVEESAALALKAGCDLNCGSAYGSLMDAFRQGLITEDEIRVSASRLMTTRFKLGILSDGDGGASGAPESGDAAAGSEGGADNARGAGGEAGADNARGEGGVPESGDAAAGGEGGAGDAAAGGAGCAAACDYDDIPFDAVDCREHRELSIRAAAESCVLLKNDGLLPLDKSKIKRLAVIGPNADSRAALKGNYYGNASQYVTIADGLRGHAGGDVSIHYSEGCKLTDSWIVEPPAELLAEAAATAEFCDVTVLVLGLDETIEGEEALSANAQLVGDKPDLKLPEPQRRLLKTVLDVGKPVVVILMAGSAIDLRDAQNSPNAGAILNAWYPGALGGTAVARLLFGDISPCGKLPVTFYNSADDLPDFTNYSMANRTYRYFTGEALYPFGYGLTYGDVRITDVSFDPGSKTAGVTAVNRGAVETKDVIQAYIKSHSVYAPVNPRLCAFRKETFAPGESKTFMLPLPDDAFTVVDDEGGKVPGGPDFELYIGTGQPDRQTARLSGRECARRMISVGSV